MHCSCYRTLRRLSSGTTHSVARMLRSCAATERQRRGSPSRCSFASSDIRGAYYARARSCLSASIGYMRVSKADGSQVLDLQRDTLLAAGVKPSRLYQDDASGKKDDRPGLEACLKSLREADTLIVWKLDRLGRNLRHLVVNTIHNLMERKIGFRVLTGQGANIDTTTASGRLVFGIFAALAEFERELIRERTGSLRRVPVVVTAAVPTYTMTPAKLRLAQAAMAKRDTKVGDLCKELGVTRQTLYRFVGPKGQLRTDGTKLLKRKSQRVSS
jgi:Resolvase, N terminal domain